MDLKIINTISQNIIQGQVIWVSSKIFETMKTIHGTMNLQMEPKKRCFRNFWSHFWFQIFNLLIQNLLLVGTKNKKSNTKIIEYFRHNI
jgi:ABC-type antimicrobial peptide transport system permease subunit